MNNRYLGALVVAAASLLAVGASAQNTQGNPGAADKAGDKAEKAANKAGDKAEKAADKAGQAVNNAADKTEKAVNKLGDKLDKATDRASRKAKEHDDQRDKLKGVLKAPMDEPMKQELRRHAERVARLERVRDVATAEKDTKSADKAKELLTKENERHDTWVTKHVVTPVMGVTPTTGTQGGAK